MDVASYDDDGGRALDSAIEAAKALPSDGWLQRLVEGSPFGAVEALLSEVRGTVYARAKAQEAGYGLETELAEPDGALVSSAAAGGELLESLQKPLAALARRLEAVLEDAPDWLDAQARARVEGAIRGLSWRRETLAAWIALLGRIGGEGDPEFVDWLAVERMDGREYDVAIHRRWLDPTKPLAAAVLSQADGVLVTSATLRGGEGWNAAEARTGALHLANSAEHFEAESPFDYAACAEVLIVTDIKPGDIAALSGAYARLIEAAGGGTLGLFTAIQRLKAVHARIADRLARAGLPLLAQHVDPIDAGTLVDIFRDDPRASLLGTDALRDGVDVPGESLRLVVVERVPWPRPTVLHAARRMAGGGSAYDNRVVRARLAQAFGRLIRRDGDRGMFVLLSAAMPSRLLSAFPRNVPIRRLPLDQAIARVAERLGGSALDRVGEPVAQGDQPEDVDARGLVLRNRLTVKAAGPAFPAQARPSHAAAFGLRERCSLPDTAAGGSAAQAPRRLGDNSAGCRRAASGAAAGSAFPNSEGCAGRLPAPATIRRWSLKRRVPFRRSPPNRLPGDPVAHDLARAEGHHPARSDRHFDAGLGIAADTLPFVAQDESAEARDLHIAALGERCAHVVQHALDDVRRFGARQAELAMDDVREVGARQRVAGVRFIIEPRDPESAILLSPALFGDPAVITHS